MYRVATFLLVLYFSFVGGYALFATAEVKTVTQEVTVTQEITVPTTEVKATTPEVTVEAVLTTTKEAGVQVLVERCDLCGGYQMPIDTPKHLLPQGLHNEKWDICHRCCEKLLFKSLEPLLETMGVQHHPHGTTEAVTNGPGR